MILIFYWRVKVVFNHPRERGEFLSASKFKEIKRHCFNAGFAARLGGPYLFPDVRLKETRGCTDSTGTKLWLESLLWGSECFNRAASSANDGWLSPHEVFYGGRPPLPLLPFFHPAYYRTPRARKMDLGQ